MLTQMCASMVSFLFLAESEIDVVSAICVYRTELAQMRFSTSQVVKNRRQQSGSGERQPR